MTLSRGWRIAVAVGSFAVLAVAATVYVVRAGDRSSAQLVRVTGVPLGPTVGSPGGPVGKPGDGLGMARARAGPRELVFVDSTPGPSYGTLAAVPLDQPSATRVHSDVRCARVYVAHDRLLCLRVSGDLVGQFTAVVMDTHLRELRTIPIAGAPSRARISPDGKFASWTVFVFGDSYTSVGFSTRTSILNLATGELIGSLETFTVIKDGAPWAVDINFWGVTVAPGSEAFYATMATGGHTYLIKGELRTRTVRTIRENVECPSLSPDGTRLVFKKRVPGSDGRRPWRLYLLNLRTMTEVPLAETHSVDDQAAWLDDRTIAYALPQTGITAYDTWAVKADGSGTRQLLLRNADSPAPLIR